MGRNLRGLVVVWTGFFGRKKLRLPNIDLGGGGP
jgi:hypothetical protein